MPPSPPSARRAAPADPSQRQGPGAQALWVAPTPRTRRTPDKIDAIETEIAQIDEKLADPSLYSGDDPKQLEALVEQRKQLETGKAELYERWEELEALAAESP